jgi:hypothetical protein
MRNFQPAIYICTDCHAEHYGDRQHLPISWNRCTGTGVDAVRCGSCLEQIAQRHVAARAPRPLECLTAGMMLGILASRFAGALMLASDMPRPEPRQ